MSFQDYEAAFQEITDRATQIKVVITLQRKQGQPKTPSDDMLDNLLQVIEKWKDCISKSSPRHATTTLNFPSPIQTGVNVKELQNIFKSQESSPVEPHVPRKISSPGSRESPLASRSSSPVAQSGKLSNLDSKASSSDQMPVVGSYLPSWVRRGTSKSTTPPAPSSGTENVATKSQSASVNSLKDSDQQKKNKSGTLTASSSVDEIKTQQYPSSSKATSQPALLGASKSRDFNHSESMNSSKSSLKLKESSSVLGSSPLSISTNNNQVRRGHSPPIDHSQNSKISNFPSQNNESSLLQKSRNLSASLTDLDRSDIVQSAFDKNGTQSSQSMMSKIKNKLVSWGGGSSNETVPSTKKKETQSPDHKKDEVIYPAPTLEPAPTAMKKSVSASFLNASPTETSASLESNAKSLPSSSNNSPDARTREEMAAITIQRMYRIRRMKYHFQEIKQNITRTSYIDGANTNQDPTEILSGSPTDVPSQSKKSLSFLKNSKSSVDSLKASSTILESHLFPTARPIKKSMSDLSLLNNDSSVASPKEKDPELMASFIHDFNTSNPSKAVMRAIEARLFNPDCDAVAKVFLTVERKISKTALGNYLGEGEPFNISVLKSFVYLMNFKGQSIDNALRKLLSKFRLPGEAQKIDRIMNSFALKYCENNPNEFSSSDTAYVLSFSLIMLNTDAHNPNVKTKMTLKDFIRNNRGINNEKDLPEETLKRLYYSIVNNEIKMHDESEERRKFEDVIGKLIGKVDGLEDPKRVIKYKFTVNHVYDIEKQDPHKHERIAFILNDMLLLVKAIKKKYHYKVKFSLDGAICTEINDIPGYQNLLSLWNSKDESISLCFSNSETLQLFKENFVNVVEDYKEDQKTISKKETLTKVAEVKAAFERTYGNYKDSYAPDPNEATSSSNNRYAKYGSLREARAQMHNRRPVLQNVTPNEKKDTENSEDTQSAKKESTLPSESKIYEDDSDKVFELGEQPFVARGRSNTVHGYSITSITSRLFENRPELKSLPPASKTSSQGKLTSTSAIQAPLSPETFVSASTSPYDEDSENGKKSSSPSPTKQSILGRNRSLINRKWNGSGASSSSNGNGSQSSTFSPGNR